MTPINPLTNKKYVKGDLLHNRELINYYRDVFDDYAIYQKLFDDNQRTYFTRDESAEIYDGIYKMMDEIKKRVQYLEDFIFEKSPVDRHGKDPREDDMPF